MPVIKSYNLSAVGTELQFGKTGGIVTYDAENQLFSLKQPDITSYSSLAVQSLDVVVGDVSLVTGRLNINGASIQWQQPGVLRFNGSAALQIPSGNNSTRPAVGLVGMIRVNTQSSVRIEYFDGTQWVAAGGNTLPLTGGTMTGNIVMSDGATITGLPAPSAGTDAVPKSYVDNLVSGLSWKQAVSVLSDENVDVNNPSGSSIGGASVISGDRILLVNQDDNSQNGIWIFNGVGQPMVRSSDANTPSLLNGAAVFVLSGFSSDTGWTQTSTLTSGFSGQVWTQFTSGAAYYAGTALSLVGGTFNVNVGPGLTVTGGGNGILTVNPQSNTALQLNESGELYVKLESSGGLVQSLYGLKIGNGSVTSDMLTGNIENSKLQNSSIALTDGVSIDNVALGDAFGILGDGPVSTNLVSKILTVSVAEATTTTTGVASFSSDNFAVDNGEVSVTRIDAGTF